MTRAARVVRVLMAAVLLAWSSFASAQAMPVVAATSGCAHPARIVGVPHVSGVPHAAPHRSRHASGAVGQLCACPLMAPWMAAAPVPLTDPVCTTRAASVAREVTRTGLPTTPSIPPPRRFV